MILLRHWDMAVIHDQQFMATEHEYFPDTFFMPLAHHRLANLPNSKNKMSEFYMFHRTNTSMADFLLFMEYESTLVREVYEYIDDVKFLKPPIRKKEKNLAV